MIYNDCVTLYKGDEVKKGIHVVDLEGWLKEGWTTEKENPMNSPEAKTLKLDNTTPLGPTETRKKVTKEPE
jgi:hypothetical protein